MAVILHEQHIEVAVVDRGHGLAEPERLFEPFFSTKSQGLGMGLNICRTIIESHHGRLWADPNRRRHHFPLYPALRCTPAAGPE